MSDPTPSTGRIYQRFLDELRRHFAGWLSKVTNDLSEEAFERELSQLESDTVYRSFGLATPEYALIRLIGRVSISIGRRLGEIYDKLPRFITQARFNLTASDVAPKIGGKLELDVCIPLSSLDPSDAASVIAAVSRHLGPDLHGNGPAIEIRYNFNPNDSSRLRKDVEMAELLRAQNFLPIYLVFSTISPREEAIARLKRAGWHFLIGAEAFAFMNELIGMDFASILESESVRAEVEREIGVVMTAVYTSYAVRKTIIKYPVT